MWFEFEITSRFRQRTKELPKENEEGIFAEKMSFNDGFLSRLFTNNLSEYQPFCISKY